MVLTLRDVARHFITAFIYGVAITLILIAATFALGNQQSQAVKYQKAIACELAIPSDPETGRDPVLVVRCFTDQGIDPPSFAG